MYVDFCLHFLEIFNTFKTLFLVISPIEFEGHGKIYFFQLAYCNLFSVTFRE